MHAVKDDTWVFINYRGTELPFRESQIPLWKALSREDKNQMLAIFKNSQRKNKIVKSEDGYIINKPIKNKLN